MMIDICRRLVSVLFLLMVVFFSIQESASLRWPQVRPLSKVYSFPSASKASVNLPIYGSDGKVLYSFRCQPSSLSNTESVSGLVCYLILAGAPDAPDDFTLLNDNPIDTNAFHGRGQLSAPNLQGNCAGYPEYGRERTFRLRGMKLTILATDPEIVSVPSASQPSRTSAAIRALGLEITVTPDPGAISAIAEPVPFAQPKWNEPLNQFNAMPDCRDVVRTHVLGNLHDGFVEREHLSAPFPLATLFETTIALDAEKLQGYEFAFPGESMPPRARMVSIPVPGAHGNPFYDFACSAYESAGGEIKGQLVPRQFDRYGIVCGLFMPGKDLNLLADGVDPYSRTTPDQILPDQLYGNCADYPDWGKQREFRLRGIKLTLQFSAPVFTIGDFASHALASVQMHLRVEPDPSATSPVADSPKIIYWGVSNGPNACGTVLAPGPIT